MPRDFQILFDKAVVPDAILNVMEQMINQVCGNSIKSFENDVKNEQSRLYLACNNNATDCEILHGHTGRGCSYVQYTDHDFGNGTINSIGNILNEYLDVVEIVDSILSKLKFSVDSSSDDIRNCSESVKPNQYFSQPIFKEKYTHIISSSFPTTTVTVPLNFSGEKMLSYCTYKSEFLLNVHDVENATTRGIASSNAECDTNEVSLSKEILFDGIPTILKNRVCQQLTTAFTFSGNDSYFDKACLKGSASFEDDTDAKANFKDPDYVVKEEIKSQSDGVCSLVKEEAKRLDIGNYSHELIQNFSQRSSNASSDSMSASVSAEKNVEIVGAGEAKVSDGNASIDKQVEECSMSMNLTSALPVEAVVNTSSSTRTNFEKAKKAADSGGNFLNASCYATSTPIFQKLFSSEKICIVSHETITNEVEDAKSGSNDKSLALKSDESWFKFVNKPNIMDCEQPKHDKHEISADSCEQPDGKIDKMTKCCLEDEESTKQNIYIPSNSSIQILDLSLSISNASSSQDDIFNDSLFNGNASDMEKILEAEKYHDHDFEVSQEMKTHDNIPGSESHAFKDILVNTASGQLVMRCPSLTASASNKIVKWRPLSWKRMNVENESFSIDGKTTNSNSNTDKKNEFLSGSRDDNGHIVTNKFFQDTFVIQNSKCQEAGDLHSTYSRHSQNECDISESKANAEELRCVPVQQNLFCDQSTTVNDYKSNINCEWDDDDDLQLNGKCYSTSLTDIPGKLSKSCCDDTSVMDWSSNGSKMPYVDKVTLEDTMVVRQSKTSCEQEAQSCSHIVPNAKYKEENMCVPVSGPSIDQKVPNNEDVLSYKDDETLYDEMNEMKHEIRDDDEHDLSVEMKNAFEDDGLLNYDRPLDKKLALLAEENFRRPNQGPDRLYPIFPLRTCNRPRRIGLSRRRKTTSLHKDYKPYGTF